MANTSDLKNYWLNRGKGYQEEFARHDRAQRVKFRRQEKGLIEFLKNKTNFESVFELGCGFGRITKLLLNEFPDIGRYTAVDLSPDQIANARKYVSNDKVEFAVSSGQDLNYPSDSYDLVFASEVLMHIPPTDIRNVVASMVRISRKHIVNLDWYHEIQGYEVGGYCFNHDYQSIYKECSCKVEYEEIRRPAIYTMQFSREFLISVSKTSAERQRIWHALKGSS